MTSGRGSGTLGALVPLGQADVVLILNHLKHLRHLVEELDALDLSLSNFHQRQNVRDRLRREIDVAQLAIIAFGPSRPFEGGHD